MVGFYTSCRNEFIERILAQITMVLKVYDNLLMLLLIGYIAGKFGWTVAPESQDNYVIKFATLKFHYWNFLK